MAIKLKKPEAPPAMPWFKRLANYEVQTKYPRHLFVSGNGTVVGTMQMGQNYRVKSNYYGGYPAGYLRRIRSLFFDKVRVLHLFSGKVDLDAFPGDTVDIQASLNPTYVANAQTLTNVPLGQYDLVLADPPYSVEDSEHYGCPMVNRNKVLQALRGLPKGAHVVWLDQAWPMYRKTDWAVDAMIGMVKSTNHRTRTIFIYRRL